MSDAILKLKKLNAAYMVAMEWDYCPGPESANEVAQYFETGGLEIKELEDALSENKGRLSHEMAIDMSQLIKTL